jgi:riboflavin kinase
VSEGGISLPGTIVSGLGEGAYFMALPWVRDAVDQALGFEPYPGTLNVRLADREARLAWREIRERPALRLAPPPPDTCGGWLIPLVVAPGVRAAVVVPDVTRHAEDVLEVIAAVHVRSRLGLEEGDPVTLLFRADRATPGGRP